MSAARNNGRSHAAFAIGILALLASGCIVTEEYGVGYYGAPYYWPDYYPGYVINPVPYQVWRPGYHVAPYRDGGHYGVPPSGHPPIHAGGPPPGHVYTPAPATHPIPSIPSTPRGGGGGAPRGGGHGGGGHK